MTDYRRDHNLDQRLDIAGSGLRTDDQLPLTDEYQGLGAALQTGTGASVTVSGATVIVSGLSGIDDTSLGRFLDLSGASNAGNNGIFPITSVVDATTVWVDNPAAVTEAGLAWSERQPYSLEDDINYERTDRAQIKGVGYEQPVPNYVRPTNTAEQVPANLSNVAGKTTDARAMVYSVAYENAVVAAGNTYFLISDPSGGLPYADNIDRTGIPLFDGYDAGDHESTRVDIVDGTNGAVLEVLAGTYAGWKIYGRARQGGAGVDGYSFEVEFRAVEDGADLSTSVAYSWEAAQTTTIDFYYPFRKRLDDIPENAFRPVLVNTSAGGLPTPRQTGHVLFATTDSTFVVALPVTNYQAGWLVNNQGILIVNDA